MERNSLITLIPKERKKEFKKDSLRLLNFDGDQYLIQSEINNLLFEQNFLIQCSSIFFSYVILLN